MICLCKWGVLPSILPSVAVSSCLIYWGVLMVVVSSLVAKLCPTLATPWTVARQAPLSLGFSRQEYWSGLPFPSPGALPNPGTEPGSLHCRQTFYWLSYVYFNCYIFFLNWSPDHYAYPSLCNNLHFKVYLVWYKYCYSNFLLISICMKNLFPSLHFQSVCAPRSEVGLSQIAYVQVLLLYPFSQAMSLVEALNI